MKWDSDLTPFRKWQKASAGIRPAGNIPIQGAPLDILKQVHQSYAGYRYIPDANGDVWATPQEFRASGGGDCEDFVTSKYDDLIGHGFKDEQLRMVVGRKKQTGELHAVLTVNDGENLWVLDNQYPDAVLSGEHLGTLEQAYQINRKDWGR